MKHYALLLFFCIFSQSIASLNASRSANPKLTFFCEVDPVNIPLVSDISTLKSLAALNATVSVAIRDFSTERANFIRTLNQNNISTSAWLVVNYTQGYWANINNAKIITEKYNQLRAWTQKNNLKWEAIGLDLEIDFKEVTLLATGHIATFIADVANRLEHPQLLEDAKATYAALVKQIKADGYRAESYIFPFIYDERETHGQMLELLLGLVDVKSVDVEVPMLYTSGLPLGIGFLKAYGTGLSAVAVGTTGGDPLNSSYPTTYDKWEQLEQDLLYAYQYLTPNIYLYSLPGTVHNGWLQNIVALNWNKKLTLTQIAAFDVKAVLVNGFRSLFQGLLDKALSYLMNADNRNQLVKAGQKMLE